jgi:hypothetical protein
MGLDGVEVGGVVLDCLVGLHHLGWGPEREAAE